MILLRKASNKGLNQLKCLILPLVVYLIFAVGSGFRFGKPATMFAILRQTVLPTLIAWVFGTLRPAPSSVCPVLSAAILR